ncbi:trimeric intracellular cation channel family protein [Promineifilum sp.]|uniref:trimeric intracellular cation channel family protein n=1 Tax=Promineifilum sp. TaxID=2664178 RepID=UPI0035B4599E
MTPFAAQFQIPFGFEYFAILLWATSGAIVGWRKGYDIVGVFVIAFLSSFGGGLLRDGMFLSRLPVVLTNPTYFWVLTAAVLGVMVAGRRVTRNELLPKVVSVIDALGTPMFIVLGAEIARGRVLSMVSIVLLATVTAVGGGLLRDVVAGDTPELLRPGQYNTLLVIVAAYLYMALAYRVGVDRVTSAWIIIGLFFITRLLTIRFNWRSRPLHEFRVSSVMELVGLKKNEDEEAHAKSAK